MSGAEKSLCRDATFIKADPAELVLLEEDYFESVCGCMLCGVRSTRTGTDDS